MVNFFFFFPSCNPFFLSLIVLFFYFFLRGTGTNGGVFFSFFLFFFTDGGIIKRMMQWRGVLLLFFSPNIKKNNVHPQSVNVSQQPRNETKRPVKVNQNNYNKITIRINLIMARNNPQSIKLMLHKKKVSIPQLVNRATKIRYQKNALSIQFPLNEMEKLGTNSVNSVPSQEMPSQ